MAITHEFHFQTFMGPDDHDKYWVDVSMYPPGTGESPATPKDVWVAYLNYLRVVHPQDEYRLVATKTTTTSEVLDV